MSPWLAPVAESAGPSVLSCLRRDTVSGVCEKGHCEWRATSTRELQVVALAPSLKSHCCALQGHAAPLVIILKAGGVRLNRKQHRGLAAARVRRPDAADGASAVCKPAECVRSKARLCDCYDVCLCAAWATCALVLSAGRANPLQPGACGLPSQAPLPLLPRAKSHLKLSLMLHCLCACLGFIGWAVLLNLLKHFVLSAARCRQPGRRWRSCARSWSI